MKKFIKTLTTVFAEKYFSIIGLLWLFVALAYINRPEFWTILGGGVLFTGIQAIIDEIKLSK